MQLATMDRWAVRALLLTSTAMACTTAPAPTQQGSGGAGLPVLEQAAPLAPVAPYAPQRWRLTDPEELVDISLWFSQILIRHRDVQEDTVSFSFGGWTYAESPTRTRAEAWTRAVQVANEAHQKPDTFAALAQLYSDDTASQEVGGALFGVRAFLLYDSSALLDALATLAVGEVSAVVESKYGFHILRKQQPPAEATLSGAHLVVGYDQARWLHDLLARRPIPRRSRTEARALANDLYQASLADPSRFEQLVAEHSEHVDALIGGDLGNWSTREQTASGAELGALLGLGVNEIGKPIDTFLGFQIIQRLPVRPRPSYAMRAIVLSFDPAASADQPSSEAQVAALAETLAATLSEDPTRFAELQRKYCCERVSQWTEARDSQSLTAVLRELAIGAIAKRPVKSDQQYVIPLRVAPDKGWQPTLVPTELPAPTTPNIAYFVQRTKLEALWRTARAIAAEARLLLRLAPEVANALSQIHELEQLLGAAQSDAEKAAAWLAMYDDARSLLSAADAARYAEIARKHVEQLLLRPAE